MNIFHFYLLSLSGCLLSNSLVHWRLAYSFSQLWSHFRYNERHYVDYRLALSLSFSTRSQEFCFLATSCGVCIRRSAKFLSNPSQPPLSDRQLSSFFAVNHCTSSFMCNDVEYRHLFPSLHYAKTTL